MATVETAVAKAYCLLLVNDDNNNNDDDKTILIGHLLYARHYPGYCNTFFSLNPPSNPFKVDVLISIYLRGVTRVA